MTIVRLIREAADDSKVIASSLHATAVEAYWSGTSFVLGSAVFQPVFAAFSNAFGRKPMILLALVLFTVGTIVCSVASSIAILLAGRTLQGVGGGGLLTVCPPGTTWDAQLT